MIGNFRERALENGERELENTVLLLTRHFDQQLEDFSVIQNTLISRGSSDALASPELFKRRLSSYETYLAMKAKVSGYSDVSGLNVYDADGWLINSSARWPAAAVSIADRPYFQVLKSGSTPTPYHVELVRSHFSGELLTVVAQIGRAHV